MFDGAFTGTPHAGFGLSENGRDYRLGWRLTSAVRGDPGFEVKGGIGRHDGSILGGVGRGPEAHSPRRPATPSRALRSASRTGVVRRRRPPLGFRRETAGAPPHKGHCASGNPMRVHRRPSPCRHRNPRRDEPPPPGGLTSGSCRAASARAPAAIPTPTAPMSCMALKRSTEPTSAAPTASAAASCPPVPPTMSCTVSSGSPSSAMRSCLSPSPGPREGPDRRASSTARRHGRCAAASPGRSAACSRSSRDAGRTRRRRRSGAASPTRRARP